MKKSLAAVLTMFGVTFSGMATAEPGGPEQSFELPGIVVTSQKIEQSLREVPGTVTAYTRESLQEHNINGFHDLVNHVANLSLQKNGIENIINIRGVSGFGSALFSPAGFYVDGVNYPINQMQDVGFLDVERVEVLKGPQGTLYGRNSESGVISIISVSPEGRLGGDVSAETGMWDANGGKLFTQEKFTLNVPVLKDALSMRLVGRHEYDDGWVKNVYDGSKALRKRHLDGRFSTLWTPTEELGVTFIAEGGTKSDGTGVYRMLDGADANPRNKINWDGENSNKIKTNAQSFKVEYSAGIMDVTSITARHYYDQTFKQDADMSAFAGGNQVCDYNVSVLSEELRFASKPGGRVDWLFGLYGYFEDVEADIDQGGWTQKSSQDNRGAAAFTNLVWHITPNFHAGAGLRLDYTRLEGERRDNLGINFDKNLDYTEFLPSFSLAYDINSEVTVYAKVARGYLSGGFDNYFAQTISDYSFDAEYSWNYELGLKSFMLENRLSANLAAFFIDTEDKQVIEWGASYFDRTVKNAAKAKSYGAELELSYTPLPGLYLNAVCGYLDSQIKDWATTGPLARNYDGNITPGSSRWSYSAGVVYYFESGFFAGADVLGCSSFYSDAENDMKVKGRATVNLQMGYAGESFDVKLWAKNVFDEDYYENKWDWGGSTLAQQGDPRSVGLACSYRF